MYFQKSHSCLLPFSYSRDTTINNQTCHNLHYQTLKYCIQKWSTLTKVSLKAMSPCTYLSLLQYSYTVILASYTSYFWLIFKAYATMIMLKMIKKLKI